jgi:two-component system sensor histidine kinase KdpD
LSVIAGAGSSLLESLPETDDTRVRRELLETIVDEANRLARLVENLLSVTRLESGAVKVSKEWHVLEDVVGSAIRHVGKRLAGHALSVEIPADVPMTPLDSVLIEQVLVNLLENAARYSSAATSITVTARKQVDGVVVEVADRGVGLAAGEEERVFEKFYRGESTRTSSRGAGLGLSICRAIVQAHGGRIWASNRPDGGASFFFCLPVVEAPPSVPAEVDEESAAKKSAIP